jgi:hypothetical protein
MGEPRSHGIHRKSIAFAYIIYIYSQLISDLENGKYVVASLSTIIFPYRRDKLEDLEEGNCC